MAKPAPKVTLPASSSKHRHQQRPEVGNEGEHARRRRPQHRIRQADAASRPMPVATPSADVDDAHGDDEEADVALGLAQPREHQQRAVRGRRIAAGGSGNEPLLGGEQEVEQDDRRRRREREGDGLADRQPGEVPAGARELAGQLVVPRRGQLPRGRCRVPAADGVAYGKRASAQPCTDSISPRTMSGARRHHAAAGAATRRRSNATTASTATSTTPAAT